MGHTDASAPKLESGLGASKFASLHTDTQVGETSFDQCLPRLAIIVQTRDFSRDHSLVEVGFLCNLAILSVVARRLACLLDRSKVQRVAVFFFEASRHSTHVALRA